ncbi:hypothetical protein Lser_V15G00223 [Lactuca serriola]
MLEDIGKKVPKVKISIKKAMLAIDYIYSYVIVVNLMRKFTKERNLHRPAVTRFAISFITLAQVHRQRQLEEYSEFCRVGKGKVVQQRSDCKKKDDYKTTFQIINQRWECQLHKPLHAAGHFLNPGIFYKDIVGVACKEVEQGLYGCIMRLVPDQEVQDKISTKLDKYWNGEGLFGHPMAIRHRKTKAPGIIWIFGA